MPIRDDKTPPSRTLDDRRLRRVMQFIAANLQNDIRLKDLAEVANLSLFHFARAFRKATGESPHRFVRECRLEKAKDLLAEGNATLADIALTCNFSSQSSFTRAFTRAFGMAPGQFRKNRGPHSRK
ncbi:helix-turn-helix transcriptional regulator [Bradyrhizobium sp. Arg816]|uniref:helix-turn-helix transcriptional regulator n=1 Tax=Bradyrhizobium sp. Arg816 TaxID=2998491 RepID=UPI00249E6FAB|nr:AraC family transcriptional regulator [Bradyrhizobium sp. Arg816]MDI3561902.1 AraC family transcriptional regulator [Bradyrhizobium sp. Arg816]